MKKLALDENMLLFLYLIVIKVYILILLREKTQKQQNIEIMFLGYMIL